MFCCVISAHQLVFIPNAVKQNIHAEIDYISDKINSSKNNVLKRVKLKCYLSKLYNKVGSYNSADSLINTISSKEFSIAKGDVCLAKAINYKYQLEPEKAKYFFDQAILQYIIDGDNCKQIEVRIELMEYYRKFNVLDLALKEAEKTNQLIIKNPTCDPLLSIRYLNRLASIQNYPPHEKCIQTCYQCIDLCIKFNEIYYLAISYNEIGYAFQHSINLDSADYFYKKAENLFRSQGLIADALHTKMNRLRMYSHNQINIPELIPGLIELEKEALENEPSYDLLECYRSIWVQAETDKDWELSQRYLRKFYYLDLERMQKNVEDKIEKVKQYEKESQTRLKNLILSNQVEQQNKEIKQNRYTIWLTIIGLIVLLSIMFYLFQIIKQRNKLTNDLEKRNKQKDDLIQEVHHRVKNNLSFVSSLIEMQINSLTEGSKTDELKNASLRIESMSLVHQMLYNQDDIATVNLKSYIPELISYLKDSSIEYDGIFFDLICDDIKVESATATAFGLIITEFVTNSFKHAFKEISNPKIKIELHKSNNDLILIMSDNGVGMNLENTESKKGFGMRIIDIFSRQINASVSFSFKKGTQLTLVMKYEK